MSFDRPSELPHTSKTLAQHLSGTDRTRIGPRHTAFALLIYVSERHREGSNGS